MEAAETEPVVELDDISEEEIPEEEIEPAVSFDSDEDDDTDTTFH